MSQIVPTIQVGTGKQIKVIEPVYLTGQGIDGLPKAVAVNADGSIAMGGASGTAGAPVVPSNINTKFREAFENYTPGVEWNQTLADADIIQVDGNTGGASYLVISKNPLVQDTASSVETITTFDFPLDISLGLSRSQAALGTEFAVEMVDTGTPLTPPPDLAIATIQQTTTTLTINTVLPHGLVIGKRFQISGVDDSRLNYPALVVSAIPSPTQILATAGPAGTIPSLSVGPYATGTVSFRSALGYAENGTSMIFENASATQASFYVRSEAGDANPSGTLAGSHVITVGTTASAALVNSAFSYAWTPTTEYRLSALVDRVQWHDSGVDSTGQTTNRFNKTQIVPNIGRSYKLRVRATNNKALTVPVAKIVSITKAGSTTWTVVTDVAHGLTTTSYIAIYGNRDATNFPNLTAPTVVSSIVSPTSFTVVSTTGTAVGYGGTVYQVHGGNLPSALGAITQVVQSISRTSNILTVNGSASWSGLSIGDYINIHGCRDALDGSDVVVDGPYKVQSTAGSVMLLEPIGTAPTGADIALVNCGGAVIKRTDLRISFVRIIDFERLRVESLARPSADTASSMPVVVGNSLSISSITMPTTSGVAGAAGEGSTATGNPVYVGVKAATAIQTARTAGQIVAPAADKIGRVVGSNEQIRDLTAMQAMVTLSTTAETTIAAAVAAIFNDLRALLITNTSATGTRIDFRTVAAGTVVFSVWVPATTTLPITLPVVAKQATVNTAWTAQLGTAVTDVRITAFTIQAN